MARLHHRHLFSTSCVWLSPCGQVRTKRSHLPVSGFPYGCCGYPLANLEVEPAAEKKESQVGRASFSCPPLLSRILFLTFLLVAAHAVDNFVLLLVVAFPRQFGLQFLNSASCLQLYHDPWTKRI